MAPSGTNFLCSKNKTLFIFLFSVWYFKCKYDFFTQIKIYDSLRIITYNTFNSEKLLYLRFNSNIKYPDGTEDSRHSIKNLTISDLGFDLQISFNSQTDNLKGISSKIWIDRIEPNLVIIFL